MDLSLMAAYKLGYSTQGHARVQVELLTTRDPSSPRPVMGSPIGPSLPSSLRSSIPAATSAPGTVTEAGPATDPVSTSAQARSVTEPAATSASGPASESASGSAAQPAELPVTRTAVRPTGESATQSTSLPGARIGPTATHQPSYFVQLAAYAEEHRADLDRQQWQARLGDEAISLVVQHERGLFRLRAGPFESRAQAERALDRIHEQAGAGAIIVSTM